jgi:hypothetical protein
MIPRRFIVILAIIVSLGCIETTVVVTATPKAKRTNTPVFVATVEPAPIDTPAPTKTPVPPTPVPQISNCDPSYPDVCIAPPPPDLDCGEIPHRRFKVLPPDPHRFDGDHDGIGCER